MHGIQDRNAPPEQILHNRGFDAGNSLQGCDTLLKHLENRGEELVQRSAVVEAELLHVHGKLDGKQRNLPLLLGGLLYDNCRGRHDVHSTVALCLDEGHKPFIGALHQDTQGVLHHEPDHPEELLKLGELVSLLVLLVQVEPALANVFEGAADQVLQGQDPGVLHLVGDLVRGLTLSLLELLELRALRVMDVEDVHLLDLQALRLHLHDRRNHLGLGEKCVEGELAELVRKVIQWDRKSPGLGHLGRHVDRELVLDRQDGAVFHLLVPLVDLVEDELVHCSGKVNVDLVDQLGRVHELVLELLRVQCVHQHPVDLLVRQRRDVLCGHVVYEEVVAQLEFGQLSLLEGLLHPVCEQEGVLRLEADVHSGLPHVLVAPVVPHQVGVLCLVRVHHGAGNPLNEAVLVHPQRGGPRAPGSGGLVLGTPLLLVPRLVGSVVKSLDLELLAQLRLRSRQGVVGQVHVLLPQ